MATKNISIKEDVYNKLTSLKRKGESFSDLLERLAQQADSIELLYQMEGTIEFGDTKSLIKEIQNRRKDWRGQ